MRLTVDNRADVLEGRSSIASPSHLEDSPGALNALDSQTLAERLAFMQVFDELRDRSQE